MNLMHSSSVFSFFLITILLIVYHLKCEARDSINVSNPLSGSGDTLVSAGNRFELGFFTPEGNEKSNRYVGIWYYKLIPRTTVWVANRDEPLPDSCGLFGIAEDGNVQVWCNNGKVVPVPIKSLGNSRTNNRTLQLLDSGNLILVDGQSGTILWQSFNNPTDTFLPGMKMNDNMELTSWISPSDPGMGNYTFRQEQGVHIIQKRSAVHWKSGEPVMFMINDGLPLIVDQMLSDSDTGLDQKNSQPLPNRKRHIPYPNTSAFDYNNSRLVMNSSGQIQYYSLVAGGSSSLLWFEPENQCSVYDACGKFGICNLNYEPMCQCPRGFKPASLEEWSAGQYSEGCDRESTIICSQKYSFLHISLMKICGQVTPFYQAQKEEECKEECLNNCKCEAYSYSDVNASRETVKSPPKCLIWTTDLINLHQDDAHGRLNLSLRVPFSATALPNPGKHTKAPKNKSQIRYVIVFTVLVAGVVLVSCSSYILHRRRRMAEQPGNRGITEASPVFFSYESERQANDLMRENDRRIDVPFYNLDTILSATDNFSDANKLGQGGFGPVYKGKFPGGREIAVKRLSSCSSQGIEEFLNEVVLIAKLQHRNLVRLLGYCIKQNEKILLYEYMPNRSLDAFIFDQHNCLLLDWKKRFDIILGIARGLLYLHQDSRLRIIHRDLKTSNILLDEDMNPKISDFGLARIVEGKGTEASTNKVVGTYGYMSPEYALDGKFSIKSDVFSFGVVMLEIISGKKNTGFYNPHEVLNLLGYAWRLWNENKTLDLVDPTLLESCEKSQVMKCINIGLLCVQEDPIDRPSMSTVVIMLGSEMTPLPLPTQPAFVVRRRLSSISSSSSRKPDSISNNELTISMAEGR